MTEKNKDSLEVVESKVKNVQAFVESFKVTNEDELKAVADQVKNIKTLGKFIEQEKDKLVAPAKAIIAEAKSKYDPYITQCELAEKALKGKAQDYLVKIAQEKQREEARIAEEEKKKREKIEADLAAGKINEEKAEEKMENLADKTIQKLEKVDEKKTSVSTGSSTLGLRKVPVCKIVDATLIPDEYWILDEIKLAKVVKAGVEVPGAKLDFDYTTNSR